MSGAENTPHMATANFKKACAFLLFLLGLAFISAQARQSDYLKGIELFRAGDDLKAIEAFSVSAQNSKACLAIFRDQALSAFPELACDAVKNPPEPAIEDLKSVVWFQAARIRWEEESAKLNAAGRPERGHHDRSLLNEFLRRWPGSEFADRAALILLEDGFCQTWADYPDCGIIEAAGYENLLADYPGTRLREEIELKAAKAYCRMAWLWLYGQGQHSDRWSELFRGQSLGMARRLKKSSDQKIGKSARELEQKLINDFPRPIAPIPARVLDPNYN